MNTDTLPTYRTHGSPADRGSADAYYWRPFKPHKIVDGHRITDLTPEEVEAYRHAYNTEDDRKDWR